MINQVVPFIEFGARPRGYSAACRWSGFAIQTH